MSISFTPDSETGSSARKVIRARFDEFHMAFISLEKTSAIIAGDKYNFLETSSSGVNLQSGLGKPIAIQTMGHQGPFHRKMMFPVTLLPGPISPPIDIPYPPLMPLLPKLPTMFMALSALASLG